MVAHSTVDSIRLPESLKSELDKAAKTLRRSRSFLMVEALNRYLNDIMREQSKVSKPAHLSVLLLLAGTGVRKPKPRTAKEIDAHIRWLRGNE